MTQNHPTTNTKVDWWAKFVVGVLAISAFGPYVSAGIRTDNALTWICLPIAGLGLLTTKFPTGAWLIGWSWALMVLIALLSTFAPAMNASPYPRGQLVSGIDNLAAPLIVFIIGLMLCRRVGYSRVVAIVGTILVLGMAGNAILAILQWGWPSLNATIASLWGLQLENSTLARAATLGRYSGIMQQPALAGSLYGLALIMSTHVLARRRLFRAVIWLLILVGASVAASKAFWLVGLPVAIALLIYNKRKGISSLGAIPALFVAGSILVLALFGLTVDKFYLSLQESMTNIWEAASGGIGGITGNRFGATGVVGDLAGWVMHDAPMAGYGITGLEIATDSGFLQVFVAAGLLGLCLVLLVCGMILRTAWRTRNIQDQMGPLFVALAVVTVALSVGFPALTGNRITILLWLLLAALVSRADVGLERTDGESLSHSAADPSLPKP